MNVFERLAERMDNVTANRMGEPILINGECHVGTQSHFLPEMGPLMGDGVSFVIFSEGYRPKSRDLVVCRGVHYRVTRYQRFNGKWLIFVEGDDDEGDT